MMPIIIKGILVTIVLFLVGCTPSGSNDNTTGEESTLDSIPKPLQKDTVSHNLERDSILATAYVKNPLGVGFRNFDKSDLKANDSLEFGTKVFILYRKELDSNWVCVKTDGTNCMSVKGLVNIHELVDSSRLDMSKIPTDFVSYRFPSPSPDPVERIDNLKFTFTSITKKEFEAHRSNYDSGIVKDTTKSKPGRGYFTLPIANKLFKFHSNSRCSSHEYYLGYIPSIDCYGLESCGHEACGSYLIHKTTGQVNHMNSGLFIQGTSLPHVSKDGSKFICYTNGELSADVGTFMIMYRRSQSANTFDFSTYDSFFTRDWEIKELVWVDDHSIAISIGNQYYLKGVIKP